MIGGCVTNREADWNLDSFAETIFSDFTLKRQSKNKEIRKYIKKQSNQFS
jgi:hypothetical protein